MKPTPTDGCFVCGPDNPEGLHLSFAVDPDKRTASTVWVPRPAHVGYAGIVHGGLVSTVLDEAAGKLVAELGVPAVTAELAVRFLRPVPVGRPLRVDARLVAVRGRLLHAEAAALLEDGTEAATASAKLVIPRGRRL